MKTCIKCKLDLSDENYSKGKNICKKCCSFYYKEWRKKDILNASHQILPDKKICTICHIEFPLTEFYIRSDRNKPIGRCKKCNQKANKESWNKLSDVEKKKRFSDNKSWRDDQIKKGNLKVFFTSKLCSYKGTAEKKNIPFDLTIDYLIELFENQNRKCYYTGKELTLHSNRGDGHQIIKFGKYHYQASLDRLMPEKGYVKGNVVWCGWIVNTCKNLLTEQELYTLCETIIENRMKRGLDTEAT